MPQDRTVCDVPYRQYEDGRFSLLAADGTETFLYLPEAYAKVMVKYWAKYGEIMTRQAAEFKIPVAYIAGFLTIESGGNENACAPCTKTYTDKNGVEHQWCSLAPDRCATGNRQPVCCAYGLLGVTDGNVKRLSGGKHYGQDLLGNPELAIRYGIMVFLENVDRWKDVLVAVKRYNGGAPCQGGGVFHMGGQVGTNYVDKFVQACNTFVKLGLAGKVPTPLPGDHTGDNVSGGGGEVEPSTVGRIAAGAAITGVFLGALWLVLGKLPRSA